ncbi:MAG: hypothetical protein KF725_00550 [Cyclobacteriaceae bacterium]|nr:hypothetical protein [Cyclobacteriaceae bacterium]UYN87046.1 MAG: hypothetical protein KIT51_01855 [Cyclobacteriaceae bacterium]
MNKTLTLCLLLISTLLVGQANVTVKLYSPDELKTDIRFLIRTLENIHPNLYAATPKEKFYKDVKELEQGLTEPITRLEFARKLIPLTTALGDGHTSVYFPQEERSEFLKQGGKVFPFEVLIRNNRLFITNNYSSDSTLTGVVEVVSINGLHTPELLDHLRLYVSAELDFYKDIRIQRSFRSLLWYVLGYSNYDLELVINDQPVSKHVEGITSTQIQVATLQRSVNQNAKPYSLTITPEGFAIIDFRSMTDKKRFAVFLDSAFQVIRNKNIQHLAIDIRNNGGGSSQLGDMLFNYITDKPYRQVDRMEVKASKEMKSYFRQRYVKWYMYPLMPFAVFNKQARHYAFGKPGKIQVVEMKKLIKPKNELLKFKGQTYLLVSHYTFSSANMLADAFKCYSMGTVIGEETGGVLMAFGDVILIQLPNTRLAAGCSYKKFVHPCSDNTLRGVKPDVEIIAEPSDLVSGRDLVLEYLKEVIKH